MPTRLVQYSCCVRTLLALAVQSISPGTDRIELDDRIARSAWTTAVQTRPTSH